MKGLRNVLNKTLYSMPSTVSTEKDRKRHVTAVKKVGSDTKHQYKQTKSTQNNKRDTQL